MNPSTDGPSMLFSPPGKASRKRPHYGTTASRTQVVGLSSAEPQRQAKRQCLGTKASPKAAVLFSPRAVTTKRIGEPTTSATSSQQEPRKGSLDDFSRELLEYIVDYLDNDVPTLGALACVNKTLKEITYQDSRWESNLQLLEKKLYYDNIRILSDEREDRAASRRPKHLQVIPLSQRPLESTQFLPWFDQQEDRMEYLAQRNSRYREKVPIVLAMSRCSRIFTPQSDSWVYRNVSLRDYYRRLGAYGVWAEISCQCYCLEHNKCYQCFGNLKYGPKAAGAYCHRCGVDTLGIFTHHLSRKVLKGLSPINLFRSLPGWASQTQKDCLKAQVNQSQKEFHAWVQNAFERFG